MLQQLLMPFFYILFVIPPPKKHLDVTNFFGQGDDGGAAVFLGHVDGVAKRW